MDLSALKIDGYISEDITAFIEEWVNQQDFILTQTSGSTGEPKPIKLSKSAMVKHARRTLDFLNVRNGQSALLCIPAKYIGGKMMLVRAASAELELTSVEPSLNPLRDLKQEVDFAAMTPMQVEGILDQNPEKLDLVRTTILGGAAVSHALQQRLLRQKGQFYSTYGMTETMSHIALADLKSEQPSRFNALEQVQLSLDDRKCLIIEDRLTNTEVKTNDIVELQHNEFHWVGRYDNVINSGGVKLFPEQIEAKLAPYIDQGFYITSRPDNNLGQKVVMVMEREADHESLNKIFTNYLSKYERPKAIELVASLPRTPNGKVKRV